MACGEKTSFLSRFWSSLAIHQNTSPYHSIDYDLMQPAFIDLNFNGYLDMRLFSIFHSERGSFWG